MDLLGVDRLTALRSIYRSLRPFRQPHKAPLESPDLSIYKSDGSELRFAESKRLDTRDKINPRQLLGMTLIAAVVRCPIDVFVVAKEGRSPSLAPIICRFPVLALELNAQPARTRLQGAA